MVSWKKGGGGWSFAHLVGAEFVFWGDIDSGMGMYEMGKLSS